MVVNTPICYVPIYDEVDDDRSSSLSESASVNNSLYESASFRMRYYKARPFNINLLFFF